MSDGKAEADQDEEDYLLRHLGRGGDEIVPTVAEVQALQQRFGLSQVPTRVVRADIVQAAVFYHRHENPPTPNMQHKVLLQIRDAAEGLLKALGNRVYIVVFEKENREEWVEPPGLRKMLHQLRENADRNLADLQPYIDPKMKQRRGTRKGLRSLIVRLSSMLVWYTGNPHRVYTQNPSDSSYSGEFVEFVEAVCSMCGIDLANATIGDTIKALHADGVIPRQGSTKTR